MYPFIRYASTIAHAALQVKKGNTLTFKDTSEISFRCRLTDIDNFLEMNNGRVLTFLIWVVLTSRCVAGLVANCSSSVGVWSSLAAPSNIANAFVPLIKSP